MKGISKYEDDVPINLGVIAGNLMRREVWQCLNCPCDECDGCPVLSKSKHIDWDEVANVISKRS